MTTAKSRSRASNGPARTIGASGGGGAGGGVAQPCTIKTSNSPIGSDQQLQSRCGWWLGRALMTLLQCCRRLVERGVELAEFVLAHFGDAIVVTAFGELIQRIGEHVNGTGQAAREQ